MVKRIKSGSRVKLIEVDDSHIVAKVDRELIGKKFKVNHVFAVREDGFVGGYFMLLENTDKHERGEQMALSWVKVGNL